MLRYDITYGSGDMYEGEPLWDEIMSTAEATTAGYIGEDEEVTLYVGLDGRGVLEIRGRFPVSYGVWPTYADAMVHFGKLVNL